MFVLVEVAKFKGLAKLNGPSFHEGEMFTHVETFSNIIHMQLNQVLLSFGKTKRPFCLMCSVLCFF